MKSIGYLDPERLFLLPPQHWLEHEFCFYLHDRILELLTQHERSGAHNWVTNAFEKIIAEREITDEVDILKIMKDHGIIGPYKHHLVSHLVFGLTADMLHFLYEALSCFEKRKFAVGFALLRKPLKENLLFLAWLLADQDDFISRFEANTYSTLNYVSPAQRASIFSGAISKLAVEDAFDPSVLHDMIYSKTAARGFEPIWQRASHLITSQGSFLKTEDLSLNFIFDDPSSDHLLDPLYKNLPYVLLYAMQVALECFSCILKANEKTVSHLILTTMGCYETFFKLGKHQGITRMFSKQLSGFLNCPHCKAKLKLTKENAASMYLKEALLCYKCGLLSPFPLYWILSQTDVTITRPNGMQPILDIDLMKDS